MTETSANILCGRRGLFFKVSNDQRYILEQLKYLMPSAIPKMHIEQHTLGLSIDFGATTRVDIDKLFSHFATPEAGSKIYSPFTTLTVHNVLLMIDEESLRSSIEEQFGKVIQLEPVIKPDLTTKYPCSRNWRVYIDQPEIPDSLPFTRNGYPKRMRIRVPHTASNQRCASFVVTFYCRKCDRDGHIEREHIERRHCNRVAAGGNHSSASADKPRTPWPSVSPASSSTSKGLASHSSFGGSSNSSFGGASNSSFGGASISTSECVVEKDVVGKNNKRLSPRSSAPAGGKLSSTSADNLEALWPFLVSAVASTSKGLATDSGVSAADACVAEKDVVGKCGKRSSSKTVGGLASPTYRSPSGFYIGERTSPATTVENTENTQTAVPKKKGSGPCKFTRILSPDDKAETSQQQVSQSVEIPCAESPKKTTSKRAYRKRTDVPGSKRMKSSESKYQYSEIDDNEQCQNIFANLFSNLPSDTNCPSEENFLTAKIPSISSSETSPSKTSRSSTKAAASTSGQMEYGIIRRGEVVSTSGHDSGNNAKEEGVRLTLVERYIEEVGSPLSLQELRAFMAHAKKKSNLERVLRYYTTDSGAIVSQLEEVLYRYHRNTDTGTKEDKVFIKTLEGLCKRLNLLEVKKTLKTEVKQESSIKNENSVKKEH